ncbi:MAG: beta-galactosidase GalB [Prolixibacteraceae bacterium]
MKHKITILFCLLTIAGAKLPVFGVRHEVLLEKNWKFLKGDSPEASRIDFNDGKWQTVTVPHDWAIYGPFDKNIDSYKSKITQNNETKETMKTGRSGSLPFVGVGWYRLKFDVPFDVPDFKSGKAGSRKAAVADVQSGTKGSGKKVTLLFDGAMSHAQVWVNGKLVGNWPYGYSSFHFDITPFLNGAKGNILAVRLENLENQSRWYPGAGLYRNVHLIVNDDTYIPVWGTYLTTTGVSPDQATVNLKTTVVAPEKSLLRVETEILDPTGKSITKAVAKIEVFNNQIIEQIFKLNNPNLWSPENPSLYTAVTSVYKGDQLKDSYSTRFGIRSVKFEPEKGFFLNGQMRKFKGVCLHHDQGPIGTAINVSALRRQLLILKDMGCDAIRTSHNPPAPELLNLCDELGFMVMDEAFDEWKRPKVGNGYHLFFDEWAEKDMINLIHRDRNHPSIVLWSIGNEIGEQGDLKEGATRAEFLKNICHREDPTRMVTAGMDRLGEDLKNEVAPIVDVPGFNYKPMRYEKAYAKFPQRLIYGSETASTISSRGVYKFPVVFDKQKTFDDIQVSSYDFSACSWSQVPDDEFAKQDDLDYAMGEFVWTGFDYLGEPTPYDQFWPAHSSYFGIVDLAGLPKDRFYLYRSRWNPSKETLHLLPHWTWPGREGQVTPVFCYTNYPTAELFVNGKSMGKKSKSKETNQTRYRLMWNEVKYEPGSLRVVAYDSNGKQVAVKEVYTTGKPDHLELVADRSSILADGKELAFVTVKVVDSKGNLCPDADNLLKFKVSGSGKYRAAANGDAICLEPFHLPQMHVFKGMLTAVVQSTEKPGVMSLQVSGAGLKTATIEVKTNNQ